MTSLPNSEIRITAVTPKPGVAVYKRPASCSRRLLFCQPVTFTLATGATWDWDLTTARKRDLPRSLASAQAGVQAGRYSVNLDPDGGGGSLVVTYG